MITPDRRKRERQGCVVRGMKEESPARWAAGAAAPAPAVRRRENLRSASFREHTMEESARQGPRATTERGLNIECRGHPCTQWKENGAAAHRARQPPQ